jgi:hypothetical protein
MERRFGACRDSAEQTGFEDDVVSRTAWPGAEVRGVLFRVQSSLSEDERREIDFARELEVARASWCRVE